MSGIHLWKASCADQPPLSARTHLREETQELRYRYTYCLHPAGAISCCRNKDLGQHQHRNFTLKRSYEAKQHGMPLFVPDTILLWNNSFVHSDWFDKKRLTDRQAGHVGGAIKLRRLG